MGLLDLFLGKNTLFFRGCMYRFAYPKFAKNYEKILEKAGVDFIVLDSEPCCGLPARNAGNFNAFAEHAKKLRKWLEEHRIARIITPCPSCYYTFSKIHRFKGIEVLHITQVLAELLRQGKLKAKKKNIAVYYHDPCHLARMCGVVDEPREVIRAFAELKEFELNKEQSFCCGGGAGLPANYPKLADRIAKERAEQAKGIIVTSCPMCYHMLSKHAKVLDLSELIIE